MCQCDIEILQISTILLIETLTNGYNNLMAWVLQEVECLKELDDMPEVICDMLWYGMLKYGMANKPFKWLASH